MDCDDAGPVLDVSVLLAVAEPTGISPRELLEFFVGDTRGKGFIAALELVSDKSTKAPGSPEGKIAGRVRDVAQGKGVIIRAVRDILCFAPPFVMTDEEMEILFSVIKESLDVVAEEVLATAQQK